MKATLHTLMQKEMTRKEFLIALGLGVLSIMGFSSFLHFFSGKDIRQARAYGARPYGE